MLYLTLLPACPVELSTPDGARSILFLRNRRKGARLTIKTAAAIRYYRNGRLLHEGPPKKHATSWSTSPRNGDHFRLDDGEAMAIVELDKIGTGKAALRIDAPRFVEITRQQKQQHGGPSHDAPADLVEA